MEPVYHSQRPLSRDNLEGQTAIDLAVIAANSEEIVSRAKATGKSFVRSTLIGFAVYVLVIASPFSLFVAVHTGKKSWANLSFVLTILLAVSIVAIGRSLADVVDKSADMGETYAGTVDKIVEAILLSKAGESEAVEVTIAEVGEDV